MCLRASGHCSLRSVIAATFRNLVPKLKHSCSLCTSCCVTFPPGYLCICKQSIKAEVLSKSYAVWALFCSWKDYFCLNVSRFSSSVKLLYSETKFYSYNQILSTSRWGKEFPSSALGTTNLWPPSEHGEKRVSLYPDATPFLSAQPLIHAWAR